MNPQYSPLIGPNQFNLIRLLAAGQVLWVHSLNHLNYEGPLVAIIKAIPGVPVFFFISGLLISQAYLRSHTAGLQAFLRNRALRIFPALGAVVLLSGIMLFLIGFLQPSFLFTSQFLTWLLAQSSVVQFYNPDFLRTFGFGVLNGSLWTISVELQFYLITPILIYLLKQRSRGFFMVFILSLGLNIWLHVDPPGTFFLKKLLYVSSLPWLYMFMCGVLAASHLQLVKNFVARWPWSVWIGLYTASMIFVGECENNASNAIHPLAFGLIGLMVLKAAFPINLK